MIEHLSQMQTRLQTMRNAVLTEGTVMPSKDDRITIPEVRGEVLWYLDLLAAAVVGAHWHMGTIAHDELLSVTDKEQTQSRILEILRRDLGETLLIVKTLDYQDIRYLEMDVMEAEANKRQPPLNGHTRQAVSKKRQIHIETFNQLWMVRDEVADMWDALGADVR